MDFEDLRSALKYYLKEFDFEVQMSEFPNFNVNKDKSTFDVCLENIKSCSYFILLIGYRRGAWYNENKLSITNKEFQIARELIENGHPIRIIAFIRKQIWLLKNDREILLKHFSEYSDSIKEGLLSHGKSVVDDPEYMYKFVNEVAKGVNLPSEKEPVNNWIFQFDQFEDIVVALKNSLNIAGSLDNKRNERLLIDELQTLRDQFLLLKPTEENKPKISAKQTNDLEKENVYFHLRKICQPLFVVNGRLTNMGAALTVTQKEANEIFMYSFLYPLMKLSKCKIEIPSLEQANNSGTYLFYNITKGEYEQSLLSFAIKRLYGQISNLRDFLKSEMYEAFEKEMLEISTNGTLRRESVTFSSKTASAIFVLCIYAKIPDLIQAILNAIELRNSDALVAYDFTEEMGITMNS